MEELKNIFGESFLQKGIEKFGDKIFDEPVYPKTEDGCDIINPISENCIFKKCDGSGMLHLRNSIQGEFVRPCICNKHLKINHLIKTAKVPIDFHEATINSFDINIYSSIEDKKLAARAKRIAVKFVDNFDEMKKIGKGLYLYSPYKGGGKTRLAISILNALIRTQNVTGLYITSKNLFDELKSSIEKKTIEQVLDNFSNIQILVIDDLGVEKVTEWMEATFTQILDTRMTQNLPTIITSNLEQDQLDNIYTNGRVSSRIKKMTIPITMPEEDIRSMLASEENTQILNEWLNL